MQYAIRDRFIPDDSVRTNKSQIEFRELQLVNRGDENVEGFQPDMRRPITGYAWHLMVMGRNGAGSYCTQVVDAALIARSARRLTKSSRSSFSVGAIAARNGAFPSLLRHVIDLANHLLALRLTT